MRDKDSYCDICSAIGSSNTYLYVTHVYNGTNLCFCRPTVVI